MKANKKVKDDKDVKETKKYYSWSINNFKNRIDKLEKKLYRSPYEISKIFDNIVLAGFDPKLTGKDRLLSLGRALLEVIKEREKITEDRINHYTKDLRPHDWLDVQELEEDFDYLEKRLLDLTANDGEWLQSYRTEYVLYFLDAVRMARFGGHYAE